MVKIDHHLSEKYSTALITGASSGIGLAVANVLLQYGIRVTGTSRFPKNPALSSDIDWIEFDGSTPGGLKKFVESNSLLLSRVDILVNNSGSSSFGKASDIPSNIREQQHYLLFESPKRLTEAVLPCMKDRKSGAIVNISSLAALFKLPYMEDYSTSKAALSAYTQQKLQTNLESGITIIDFMPGDYRTNFNRNITRYGELDSLSERVWKQLEINLKKGPDPEQAARDILHALERGKSSTVCSGSFFQSKIAPVGHRVLPESFIQWAIRKYYRLP